MKNSIIKSDYQTLIYTLRGYKVMLDFDLAILYGVETKRLKEQVRRNITRFPKDFMFVLNKDEIDNLRSQFATSSWGGIRYAPMAFTEQGVAMLSSVLNSEKAIKINIEIMRAFADYRALIIRNKDFGKELQLLDEKINQIFKFLLEKIDALRGQQLDESRNKIGYKKSE
ncbi:MAG: ORF6N domain-containing protein [Bacteroidetes bacterium]|nr:ORF6N domain-containing protein [Bacteroidota bacterium]